MNKNWDLEKILSARISKNIRWLTKKEANEIVNFLEQNNVSDISNINKWNKWNRKGRR